MSLLIVKVGPAVLIGTIVAVRLMSIFGNMLDTLRFTF